MRDISLSSGVINLVFTAYLANRLDPEPVEGFPSNSIIKFFLGFGCNSI